MTAPDPADRAELTYDDATPEQVAEARQRARHQLAEIEREWPAERWEVFRNRFGRYPAA